MTLAIDQSAASRPGVRAQTGTIFRRWETGALGLILALAALLNCFDLNREGWANPYYAAAIRSMLESWHNFFFVSFDPGGFVTVDKPPLGFWIQTTSAKIFGFHGWSILLPQAVAGVTSVLVLFLIVRRAFGPIAGLVAAVAMALTPVAIADNRNNTIDSLLVLTLLLAAWAVLKATERGRLAWLLAGMALVGLGFNIKMLEAYLALPALVALYFFGAPIRWRTRFWHLGLGAAVLLAISLSWAVAVDLTPPSQRPYVGSSQHNSELELAFGYNGLERLVGMARPGGARRAPTTGSGTRPASGTTPRHAVGAPVNPAGTAPTGGNVPAAFRPPQGGGMPGFVEGGASALRLFDSQLGGQASWLLPFALFGLVAGAVATTPLRRRLSLRGLLQARLLSQARLNEGQRQLILWGVWLVVVGTFFSIAGFFHPYYLITLAPAVAALAGIGAVALWRLARRPGLAGWLLPAALVAGAAGQVYLLQAYPAWSTLLTPALLGLCLGGAALAIIARLLPRLPRRVLVAAVTLGLAGLLLTPAVWSGLTVAQGDGGGTPSGGPSAFRSSTRTRTAGGAAAGLPGLPPGADLPQGFAPPPGGFPGAESSAAESKLVAYLEANRGHSRYLLAVPNAMSASSIIIDAGRPVMALGGFSGGDPILTVDDLAQDVRDGVVRFFLLDGGNRRTASGGTRGDGFGPDPADAGAQPAMPGIPGAGLPPFPGGPGGFGASGELQSWVKANCTPVPSSDWQSAAGPAPAGGPGFGTAQQLYDCANVAAAS